ncbi:MAG TPA: hypothetical protein VER33_16395 [Polyangiaceae bacterium]|nr:hypothetical protein [Polyangiaceae bacterium]
MKRTRSSSVLVLAELGAEWPRWLPELMADKFRCVLAQEAGATLPGLGDRAVGSLPPLAAQAPVTTLVLLCNQRADATQLAERRELARRLAARLPGKHKCTLLLSAPRDCGDASRQALFALTAELQRDRWPGNVSLQVRIEEEAASRPISRSVLPRARVA